MMLWEMYYLHHLRPAIFSIDCFSYAVKMADLLLAKYRCHFTVNWCVGIKKDVVNMLKHKCILISSSTATYCDWKISFSMTLLLSSCNCPQNICFHLIKCPPNYFLATESCCSTSPKIDSSCNAPTLSLLQPRHSTSSHRADWLVWLLVTALYRVSIWVWLVIPVWDDVTYWWPPVILISLGSGWNTLQLHREEKKKGKLI